ncbi:baseplate J/gp47 family protein [Pandoraea fibrosis]|uniref:Baseplate assembly protein n=1 Tax=Pandoraea fibrosis TaxID=1891094 RepID=A0A5E4XFI6_9BURK|nr:baseplate J/gp47 family protein [Pandoraea fibrosis]VVE35149.1 baseplate assembly protein [Pandoraea fibrosis]
MSRSPTIDLSQLPPPEVIETISFEALLAQRKAHLVTLYPEHEREGVRRDLENEADPRTIMLEENTYREVMLRAHVNESARQLLLAFAKGGTLEHLGAYFNVKRHTLVKEDSEQGIDAVKERDDDLRKRIQMAPLGFSTAGPEGAYESITRGAHARVLDVTATSPSEGKVEVVVLSRLGDGADDPQMVEAVREKLMRKTVRPMGDDVSVRGAEILRYKVRARLRFFAGPDRSVPLAEAKRRVAAYTEEMHRLQMQVTQDGLFASLRVPGVQKVWIDEPLADVEANHRQAPFCTEILVEDVGTFRPPIPTEGASHRG